METITIDITKQEEETIRKALRLYHYELIYRCRATQGNPEKYPHPIDEYLRNEAEAAEQLLINFSDEN